MGISLADLLILAFVLALYLVPFLIARSKNHPQKIAIRILNLFLGWTVLGWVVALIWACMNTTARESGQAAEVETPNSKKCVFCAETIKADAIVCRFCGKDPPAPAVDARTNDQKLEDWLANQRFAGRV